MRMRKLTVLLAVLSVCALPLGAAAMSHEKHEHGGTMMEHKEHGAMMMEGGMAMLGDQTVDGVKAMAHLNDVKEAMAKIGMKETHHFMVAFVDTKTGKPIEAGTVAVKIEGPKDFKAGPIELKGMEGHFGADIILAENGKYLFKVGTQLPDGKKRQYEFKYEAK